MVAASNAFDVDLLYGEHSAWLRSWLARRTRCSNLAADLVHDTFCRLLETRSVEAIREPRSYLATTARRLLIDDVRRKDIEAAVLDAWASREGNTDMLTPERITQAVQMLDVVMRVIDALPAQAREAFLLRRIDGLEQRDIAHCLGISLSTVKRHIALAYARCYAIAYAA